MRRFRFPQPASVLQSMRRSARAGETDAKMVIIIVLSVIGGLGFLVCAGGALLLLPAFQGARNAARVTQSRNNLKIVGLGLHNYHDAYNLFPIGGTYATDETPHHSWQTALLPFADQGPLYQRINTNLPWTDPVNEPAFHSPVRYFLHPSQTQTMNSAGLALSHYAGNLHVLPRNRALRVRDFIDGTSNTMMAGEVADGFKSWGDPSNVRDPGAGAIGDSNSFGGNDPGRQSFQILLGDGSVRDVAESISPAVMKALGTYDGQEPLTEF